MYYYKTKDNKGWLEDKLQHNDENLIEITKEEFDEHLNIRKQDFNTKKHRIAACKEFLNNTDYCVIKIAEGVATAEEYAEILQKRKEMREIINQLESE